MRYVRCIKLCSAILLLAVFIAALPLAASAATWKETWSPSVYKENELNAQKFCTLTAEYSVYRTGTTELHLILTNKTNEMLGYGLAYTLERKQTDGWYAQSLVDAYGTPVMWPLIGLVAPASAAWGVSISLSIPLTPGEYRIIKEISKEAPGSPNYPFAAYFKVSADGYDSSYLSGFTPIKMLPVQYTFEQAIADGAFYQDKGGKPYNKEGLISFLTKVRQGVPAKVRMLAYGDSGSLVISDVSYVGKGSKISYRFFLEQSTLASNNKPREIIEGYYPYLIGYKKNGAYGLFLSERNTASIKTKGVDEWTLIKDTRKLGREEIEALLKDPVHGPIYRPIDPAFTVYDASGSNYAYLYFDSEQTVCYKLQNGKNDSIDLSSLKESLKELLDMEWKTRYELVLTYRTAKGKQCVITYQPYSDTLHVS